MEGKNALANIRAARVVASIFGVLAGLGGITHGIGETIQGDKVPNGIIVDSWTEGPIATNMGGEPAMTIVPNLFVTGVLTLIVSSGALVWAAAFVEVSEPSAISSHHGVSEREPQCRTGAAPEVCR